MRQFKENVLKLYQHVLVIWGICIFCLIAYIFKLWREKGKIDCLIISKDFVVGAMMATILYVILQIISILTTRNVFYPTMAITYPFVPKNRKLNVNDLGFTFLFVILLILVFAYRKTILPF